MENNGQIIKEIIVQILGFGIVFLVLKKFAWGKLLGAIDSRRKSIEDSFLDIEKTKKNLEGLEKEYRQKIERIEQEARLKIQEASKVGIQLARDIQERARMDAEKVISRAHSEIEQDLQKAKIQMRDQIVEISGMLTEKVIHQKLDFKDQEQLVDQFIKDLEKVS